MKKFLAVLAIAGFLVACNNDASSTDAKKDSIDSTTSDVKDRLDSAGNAVGASDSTVRAEKDQIDSAADVKKDQVEAAQKSDSTKK